MTKTSLENIHLGNGDHFVVIASSSHPMDFDNRARREWSGNIYVKANIENERFTVTCSRCR